MMKTAEERVNAVVALSPGPDDEEGIMRARHWCGVESSHIRSIVIHHAKGAHSLEDVQKLREASELLEDLIIRMNELDDMIIALRNKERQKMDKVRVSITFEYTPNPEHYKNIKLDGQMIEFPTVEQMASYDVEQGMSILEEFIGEQKLKVTSEIVKD
jgi:hypothetical protein